ncbi:MAG: N-acetyltransferase family protein [Archangium sp.]
MTASPSWKIRPAREEDLDGLIELGRRSWLSAFAQTAPFALIAWWARTDRTAHLYREVWPEMRVLEEQGGLVGLVQPKDDEINGLWIHPARQGVGAGTLLLRTAEALIQSAGHRTAWLTCSAWNQAALRFYESRGYVETRRDRGLHVCGVEFEDVRMERRLDRG